MLAVSGYFTAVLLLIRKEKLLGNLLSNLLIRISQRCPRLECSLFYKKVGRPVFISVFINKLTSTAFENCTSFEMIVFATARFSWK